MGRKLRGLCGGHLTEITLRTLQARACEAGLPVADLLALDQALDRLSTHRSDLAKIVECRTFIGLTINETATALDVSAKTVKRKWRLATAWLHRELRESSPAAVRNSSQKKQLDRQRWQGARLRSCA